MKNLKFIITLLAGLVLVIAGCSEPDETAQDEAPTVSDTMDQAAETASDVKEGAVDMTSETMEETSDMASDTKEGAVDMTSETMEETSDMADEAQSEVMETMDETTDMVDEGKEQAAETDASMEKGAAEATQSTEKANP